MIPRRPPLLQRFLGSARLRILASVVLLLTFSTVVTDLALRQILLARTGERVDDSLTQEAREFRRLVHAGRDPRTGRPFGDDIRAIFDIYLSRNVPGEGERFATFLDGAPYRSSSSAPPPPGVVERVRSLAGSEVTVRGDLATAEGDVRFLVVPVVIDGRTRGAFAVTVALGPERAEVTEAVRVAAGVSIAVLLFACLLAFLIAGRILRPLRDVSDTARSISETDLTQRIPVDGDDEIATLARTFNAMLDRLEGAFASQRAFVTDASHELRTPITIIRGHLELLGDDPEERRETVELVTDELDRMARFVDDLLTLAKAERPDFLRWSEVDLEALTSELMNKLSAMGDRRWRLDRSATGSIQADRQRLTQAIVNLAGNAVQHTEVGDEIALGSELRDGHARLWVRDTGPGVPTADQARIFERFARVEGLPRRSQGAGLGLAIVRAIAEAHGGDVELLSEPGAGATFTVVLPVRPPVNEEDKRP